MDSIKPKFAVLSLSGGMDSSTLLLHLLEKQYHVTCLSFDYGQKHKVELERATDLVNYLNDKNQRLDFNDLIGDTGIDELDARSNYPEIKHQIIKLDGLSSLLNSTLVEGGSEVPEGHYEADNMRETVVPNRNKIFSSIIQAVALSLSQKYTIECEIALGLHAGDHRIYFDCRQEFRDADYQAFLLGNEYGDKVQYYTPYLLGDKFDILKDGLSCCQKLGLDFNEVYKRTNTSYKPIQHTVNEMVITAPNQGYASLVNKWFSDYKSASSVERIEAFIKLGIPDPVRYANEQGPVTWEVAKQHVESLLSKV